MINLGEWTEGLKRRGVIERIEVILEKIKGDSYFPSEENIFKSLKKVPPSKVKVVILGQDPYHEKGQANGLAFAVSENVAMPPSLRNIFKEIKNEYGTFPTDRTLESWANQGVLLLNATLTVEEGKANSHSDIGWQDVTEEIFKILNEQDRAIVYLLWGKIAQKKKKDISNTKHLVLESAHPSPLSAHRGFLGNGHFKKANEFLKANGVEEIDFTSKDL